MCFRWLPIREKNLFPAILPFWRLVIGFYLRTLNFFDYFQNSVTVKSREGYCGTKISSKLALFASFRCLPIEGIFLQILYNSQIFVLINEIIKCFFNVVAGFRRSYRLPIEEIYFRRTNLAFSIRYISEQISRLKLRHGRMRQLLGSMTANLNTAPTNT